MKFFSAARMALVFAWLVTTVAAAGAGAYGYKNRAKIRGLLKSVQSDPITTTNLHLVKTEKIVIPAEGRDGGIAALGNGILLASNSGSTWFVDSAKTLRALPIKVPINLAEFKADPFNQNTLYQELFGVKDIAVQTTSKGVRLLASYAYWNVKSQCTTMRVSALETTQDKLIAGTVANTWETIYETTPCRPLEKQPDNKQRLGLGYGGRIVPVADGGIVLTVGGFDPENEIVIEAPQKRDNSYGKTIWINPETHESRIFTMGHRNPQGLAVAANGQIWLTEHAARGGDELNLLGDGKNYGYPRVHYGTQYEMMEWPHSKRQGRHDGYEQPMYAWVPSIGISNVVVLEKGGFPHWQGDVVVASLAAQSLFRVRVENDRVIFVEPIQVGHRVRDIVESNDGSLVMKTDDDFLIYMTALRAATATTPLERGALIAATCEACHSMKPEGGDRIGPPLWNVVGREVAAQKGFNYSAAMKSQSGRWTEDRLKTFLKNPSGVVPGTTMTLTTQYTDQQLADVVEYLKTLQ
jgi:cytochrome c2